MAASVAVQSRVRFVLFLSSHANHKEEEEEEEEEALSELRIPQESMTSSD